MACWRKLAANIGTCDSPRRRDTDGDWVSWSCRIEGSVRVQQLFRASNFGWTVAATAPGDDGAVGVPRAPVFSGVLLCLPDNRKYVQKNDSRRLARQVRIAPTRELDVSEESLGDELSREEREFLAGPERLSATELVELPGRWAVCLPLKSKYVKVACEKFHKVSADSDRLSPLMALNRDN